LVLGVALLVRSRRAGTAPPPVPPRLSLVSTSGAQQ
jgi:hypothetical protein